MALATRLTPFSKINQAGPSMPNGTDLDKLVSAIDSIQGQSGAAAKNGKFADLSVTGTLSVTGGTSYAGNVAIGGTLTVTGASSFTGAVAINNTVSVAQPATFTQGFSSPTQAVTTSTTGTVINPWGQVTLATTTAGQTYNITANPVAGAELKFFCTAATSQLITSSSTAITIQSTTGLTQKIAAFTLAGQALTLTALSSIAWAVTGNIGGVTFS